MTTEERALHGLVYQLEAAWNAADAAAFAALFADDADFIHVLGGYYTARAGIEAGHRMTFGTIYRGSVVHYSVEKIKFLRPDVAVVLLRQHVQFAEDGVAQELDARPTLIAEKADGQWQIVMLQNTRITEVGRPSNDGLPDRQP